MNQWPVIAAGAEFVANLTTVACLLFVAWQIRIAAQSSRVQAWAFLLDTSNSRWSAYGCAIAGRERLFALGELLNFLEVLAGDVNKNRLPKAIAEQVAPYLIGVIAMMSRDDEMGNEVRLLRVNEHTFCELRAFCDRRINEFGDYTKVAPLFAGVSS